MRGIFRAIYSEIRGLHQSAYILAFFSLASQILALARDRLFAHQFGANTDLDIYYAAFKIPDLLFVLFASVLSVYVLIPFIVDKTDKGDTAGAQTLLSSVLMVFIVLYTGAALMVGIFADSIASLVFPGFEGAEKSTLVLLMRVLLLQPLLLGVSGLLSVVTQIGQRFVLYAISPLLYNAGIIFGVLVLYPRYGLSGVVWGVVLGAALHMLIQLPLMWTSELAPRLICFVNFKDLAAVFLVSTPRALTLSLNQIVLLAFVGIASSMAAGSVSVFQFALNLQSVPLAIIGVSYSVAAFPILAHLFSKGEYDQFVMRVETTLRHLAFWIIPITALVVVLRAQFVRVVLGSGAFDWQDTRLTAATLALFALSLLAQSVNLLIVRAFYAGGNTKTPFVVTAISTFATLALSFALYALFIVYEPFARAVEALLRVEGIPGTEIMMLPLGYSIVQSVHALYLLFVFARMYKMPRRAFLATCGRALVAGLGGAFVAYITLNVLVDGVRADTFVGVFVQGALGGVFGLSAIVGLLYLMKSPELRELWGTFRRWSVVAKFFGPDSVDTLAL